MLKPLAIQSLLDSLTSSSSELAQAVSQQPDVAMLTLVESGQIYASSARTASGKAGENAVVLPRPRFRALMCAIAPSSPEQDDERRRALSALAAQAWHEVKRDIKGAGKRARGRQESRQSGQGGGMGVGSDASEQAPFLSLKSEDFGLIHIHPLVAAHPLLPSSPPISSPSSPSRPSRSLAALDEEESKFYALDDRQATMLLVLNSTSSADSPDATIQAFKSLGTAVAKALAPHLTPLDR